MNTLLIQVTNQKAIGLLHELEELHSIKVLKDNSLPVKRKKTKIKLSEKYRNVFSKEAAKSFIEHTKQMRNELDNT